MSKNNISIIGSLIAAILSTVCCIVPLLLLVLGVGGAWAANLTGLEPYKPAFIGVSLILLVVAYKQIFLKPQSCKDEEICSTPENTKNHKIIFWIIGITILSSSTISYWAPLFY